MVDEKHDLIVSCDVVNENCDDYQFADQINQNIEVIVPSSRQASDKTDKPFDVRNFTYDRENDSYICPKGNVLPLKNVERKKRRKVYLAGKKICSACEHFGTCTTNRLHGRKVTRLLKEDSRRQFERKYMLPENQEIYKLRKQKVELPFGHIKYNLGVSGFLLRGLAGVKAEFSILTSCFNITRMIRLLGTENLVELLRAVAIAENNIELSPKIAAKKQTYAKMLLRILQHSRIGKKPIQPPIAAAA